MNTKNYAYRSGKRGERKLMDDFKPITTQEEFDAAIKSRLARERETITKQYADYDSMKTQLQQLTDAKAAFETSAKESADQIKSLNEQLTAANTKIKDFEVANLKTSAALAAGIPMEFAGRLSGETKEDIEKDAASVAKLFKAGNNRGVPRFEQNEGVPASEEEARKNEFRKLVKEIQNKGE